VLAEVHGSDGYPVDWPHHPGEWLMQPAQLAAWVAEVNGHVIGHVSLSRGGSADTAAVLWSRQKSVPLKDIAVVSRLFVSPTARGRGVAALMMATAVQDAQARAVQPVLDVLSSDMSAVALYERLGWRLLGTVDQEWGPAQTVSVRCYAAPA
jgi:GNAT superfamily N-acetyltransferase